MRRYIAAVAAVSALAACHSQVGGTSEVMTNAPAAAAPGAPAVTPPASAVFAKGGGIGLVPPTGMREAADFAGFSDPASDASITLNELPPEAYAATIAKLEAGGTLPGGMAFADRGTAVTVPGASEARRYAGTQSAPQGDYAKWLLIARGPGFTALVAAQVPAADAAAHAPAITAALASVTLRASASVAQASAALPFMIGDRAGLRLVRTMNGSTALLTEGPRDVDPTGVQPMVIVASSLGKVPVADAASTARAAFRTVPELQDVAVNGEGATPIGGYRIAATATRHGRPVTVIQHLLPRAGGGYVRTICAAPRSIDFAARCDRLAASIKPASAGDTAATAPPAFSGLVVDQAQVLDPGTEQRLTTALDRLQRSTAHQFAVVTVPTLGGADVASYASRLATSWGIGRKGQNDGILLLVAPHERKARIAVGAGLRTALPDAFCQDVLDRRVVPAFAKAQYGAGIEAGVAAITAKLSASPPG